MKVNDVLKTINFIGAAVVISTMLVLIFVSIFKPDMSKDVAGVVYVFGLTVSTGIAIALIVMAFKLIVMAFNKNPKQYNLLKGR